MSKWKWEDFGQYVEVLPMNDTKEHFAGDECWCKPKRIEEAGERPVISHNAADGREQAELRAQLWFGVPFKQALQNEVARHQTGYTYEQLKEEIANGDDLLEESEVEEVDRFVNLLLHMFTFYHSNSSKPTKDKD